MGDLRTVLQPNTATKLRERKRGNAQGLRVCGRALGRDSLAAAVSHGAERQPEDRACAARAHR